MNNEALKAARKGNLKVLQQLVDDDIDVDAKDDEGRTLLHHATINGHPKIVQCLLKNGADVLLITDKCNTALHLAAAKSDESLAKIILDNVSRDKLRRLLDAKTKATGSTALHVAAKRDSHAVALLLLEHGANFEIANDAGETPMDVASGEKIRDLLRIIGANFEKTRHNDETVVEEAEKLDTLVADIQKLDPMGFTALVNCRDNEGRCLMQTLVSKENYEFANMVMWMRIELPIEREHEPVKDPSRKRELDELAEGGREFMDFWEEHKVAMDRMVKEKKIEDPDAQNLVVPGDDDVKKGALALKMAHEVLLKYRKFEGAERSVTTEPRMKTLAEMIEVIGFDAERLCADEGEESGYYEKLPAKWKDNPAKFVKLIDCTINPPIDYFLGYIYATQHFEAVRTDDTDKVQQLIDKCVINHSVGPDGRTALYIAVEKGNESMIRQLLDAHASVNNDGALSPVLLAVRQGNAKMVQLLLEKVYYQDLPKFIDEREANETTCLHEAAKLGHLDIVKILLKFGATYWVLDGNDRKPIDVSTSEDVTAFLKLVNDCFTDAKTRNNELVRKLEAMPIDDFLAVTATRSQKGKALGEMAEQCNAKEMAETIWKMMDKTKFKVTIFP